MKQYLFYFIFTLGSTFSIFSQVGIKTEDPTAVLDINGDLRIRDVPTWQNPPIGSTVTKNKTVLVKDDDGNVYSDPNIIKTTFIRGGNETGTVSLVSLGASLINWSKISFKDLYFDDNNEFDTTKSEFVAKKTGIYAVYVQYQTSSAISAGITGVGVLKRKNGATVLSVIAEESFANLSVVVPPLVNVLVTPPTRKVFTIVDMNMGDALFFGATGLSASIVLLGGTSSYFTIFQIK